MECILTEFCFAGDLAITNFIQELKMQRFEELQRQKSLHLVQGIARENE